MRGPLTLLAKRYIAGTERKDAIGTAQALNGAGLLATIDNLGENVKDKNEALASVREYICLLDEIRASAVSATVSLKLTHLGLAVSDATALENAGEIIKKAALCGNSVCFDMEGSAFTQRTLDIFLELRKKHSEVGIAIQSCLKRSERDINLLVEKGASVRLVKGAYKEPPSIAYEDKRDVDASYVSLMKELLLKGNMPAIATHDERLIEEAKRFAREKSISQERFEFQMLLGIKRDLQKKLAKEGYRVRVYVPYGPEWLPYTLRRLRERKENIFFILRNIFD